MDAQAPAFPPSPAPLEIGTLLYPDMTLLDLAGPQAALGMHGPHAPVLEDARPGDDRQRHRPAADHGLRRRARQAGRAVRAGRVRHGRGDEGRGHRRLPCRARTRRALRHLRLLRLAAARHGGAAGRLPRCDALEALGVQPSRERVVVDRNRFTGGGVTAGIDFGLVLLAELRGAKVARMTQLMMEYDPAPPFGTGHPRTAGPEPTAAVLKAMGNMSEEAVGIAKARREREAA